MAVQIGIPPSDSLVDRQFVEIPGPDGSTKGFQYDAETKTVIQRQTQVVIPSFHGPSHVEQDPIPEATQYLRGLLSAADKAKLDALTQTRLGVLGFQGSGFPDDGGFLQNDIILAAGSEFISLERVGNVIRFTVDSPVPLTCNCEECAQIYWIQDESESRSVRPPSCNGIMPDASMYGELKVYTYPESTIFNPNKPDDFFNQKSNVPVFAFTRYENGNEANAAQLEAILKRRSDGTTNVGWAFTPGPNLIPQCKWFMGNDREGRQVSFELLPSSEPGLLGALLYNGHTITRQTAVITGYDTNVLNTNIYKVKRWSVQDGEVVGDEFSAQNIWKYDNPEDGDATPTSLVLDKTVQLLNVGEIVELWQFQLSKDSDGNITWKSYFNKRPTLNAEDVWTYSSGVRFGDLLEERDESDHQIGVTGTGTETKASISNVSDRRLFERAQWGITNFDDDLLIPDDGDINTDGDYEPGGTLINNRLQAVIDHSIPGLEVVETPRDLRGDINGNGVVDNDDLDTLMSAINTQAGDACYNSDADLNDDNKVDVKDLGILATNMNVEAQGSSDRPIWLWDRQNHENFIIKAKVGQPTSNQEDFPPIDVVLSAPIDYVDNIYFKVKERGLYETGPFANLPYIKVEGTPWMEIPSTGNLRVLTGVYREIVWNYQHRIYNGNEIILVGHDDIFPFDEDFIRDNTPTACTDATAVTDTTDVTSPLPSTSANTTVVELLHVEYTTACARLQFSVNDTTDQESVRLQFRVGTLSMSTPYELNDPDDDNDDYVRGFLPGEFSVSDNFVQAGFITDGIGADVKSNPDDFRVYKGGLLPAPVGNQTEKWNDLEIMKKGTQVWIWWNSKLVSPSQSLSATLPTPVSIITPYFPVSSLPIGKVGLRLWPGAVIREVEVRDQNENFNEYTRGQLQIDCG